MFRHLAEVGDVRRVSALRGLDGGIHADDHLGHRRIVRDRDPELAQGLRKSLRLRRLRDLQEQPQGLDEGGVLRGARQRLLRRPSDGIGQLGNRDVGFRQVAHDLPHFFEAGGWPSRTCPMHNYTPSGGSTDYPPGEWRLGIWPSPSRGKALLFARPTRV